MMMTMMMCFEMVKALMPALLFSANLENHSDVACAVHLTTAMIERWMTSRLEYQPDMHSSSFGRLFPALQLEATARKAFGKGR